MVREMKRTDFEICKLIFEALFQNNPIHKSDLRNLTSLGPKSIDKWVNLIAFIQSQPALKVKEIGRHRVLELEKPPLDQTLYPETLDALKAMKILLELPPSEMKKRLEELESLCQ
jgi:hypothetical protein